MSNNPFTGIGYALTGLKLIFKPGVRRFVIIPVLVNIIVFSALIWGGGILFDDLMLRLLPEDSWLSHLSWILWPLFAITGVLVVFFTFTAVANLIAAPFNGLLAEKVEFLLTGKALSDTSGWVQVIRDIVPSIMSELRKLLYFLLRAALLLILFLIPGINVVAPFLWLAFNAWYLALEYMDFPMGNHNIRFKEQHRRLRKIRFNALGFGAGITLLMAVPGINFLAMPTAVAGATALWHKELNKS